MRHNDLADYLDSDPFQEPSEPRPKVLAQSDILSEPKLPRSAELCEACSAKRDRAPQLSTPVTPEEPKRSETFERDKYESDILRMVMEVFPGARWTTCDEYKRLAHNRDRNGRRKGG